MLHAIEACCAYWRQWCYRPLTEDRLRHAINALTAFEDPTILHYLKPDTDLFEFMLYMHRTQMDMQGEVWWMPVGKFTRLFADAESLPATSEHFLSSFGVSLKQWLQLTFAVHTATALRQCYFSHDYAQTLSSLGLPLRVVNDYLKEVSRSPMQIAEGYRRIRLGDATTKPAPPLTWMQRRPQTAHHPLIRLQRGYVAPVEAYIADLFGESLFRRLIPAIDHPRHDVVRKEVGARFERYVEDVLRHHLPGRSIWNERDLEVPEVGRSCDLAVDLEDSILLIECKAVTFDRELVTRTAVLESPAISRIVSGFDQLICTSQHLSSGQSAALGMDPTKPRYGIVVTLGEVPGANYPAVWSFAQGELAKRGTPSDPVPSLLADRPQAFHGFAIEHLALCLRTGIGSVSGLFAERKRQPPLAMGDWGLELQRKCVSAGKQDLGFWRSAGEVLLSELVTVPPPQLSRPTVP